MEWEAGPLLLNTNIDIISPLFSFNLLNIEIFKEVDSIPRVGDLWLSIATVSSSHRIREAKGVGIFELLMFPMCF